MKWMMVLVLLGAWVMTGLIVMKGIKSSGKVYIGCSKMMLFKQMLVIYNLAAASKFAIREIGVHEYGAWHHYVDWYAWVRCVAPLRRLVCMGTCVAPLRRLVCMGTVRGTIT